VQVGPGAELQHAPSSPVISPAQAAWDPVEQALLLTSDDPAQARTVFRFDRDLTFRGSRESSLVPAQGRIEALTVRIDPREGPLLHLLAAGGGSHFLLTETLAGEPRESRELFPPLSRFDKAAPVGLTWEPVSDTFYYLEGLDDRFVQMDLAGNTLRSFAHPVPPENSFITNEACWIVPERGTLLTTVLPPGDLEVPLRGCGFPCPVVSQLVELRLDGTPTGYAIPLRRERFEARGVAVVGAEAFAVSPSSRELLRLKAFSAEGGEEATFRRGDSNGDGTLDLSDPVHELGFLFLGGSPPRCFDAADADDDGELAITDAIYVLGHLFLGSPAPPEPYPEAGTDPTPDGLHCPRV